VPETYDASPDWFIVATAVFDVLQLKKLLGITPETRPPVPDIVPEA
jgi:hypothetical protein